MRPKIAFSLKIKLIFYIKNYSALLFFKSMTEFHLFKFEGICFTVHKCEAIERQLRHQEKVKNYENICDYFFPKFTKLIFHHGKLDALVVCYT